MLAVHARHLVHFPGVIRMFIGTLSPVSNRADWIDAFQLLDEEDPSEPVDISDATAITVEVRAPGTRSVVLTAGLGSGITHIETGVFQWPFTAAQMSRLDRRRLRDRLTIVQGRHHHAIADRHAAGHGWDRMLMPLYSTSRPAHPRGACSANCRRRSPAPADHHHQGQRRLDHQPKFSDLGSSPR